MSARRRALAAGLVPLLAAGTAGLLRRMRADFAAQGAFRPSTAAAMWTTYAAGTLAYLDAVRRTDRRPGRAEAVVCATTAAAGAGLVVAGMGAFSGAAQITGTDAGSLNTHGVYRVSRNPQYAGIVLVAAAGAVASRRADALALAAGLAAAYRAWVPVEERALERTFGAAYLAYRDSTPRWCGLPRRR